MKRTIHPSLRVYNDRRQTTGLSIQVRSEIDRENEQNHEVNNPPSRNHISRLSVREIPDSKEFAGTGRLGWICAKQPGHRTVDLGLTQSMSQINVIELINEVTALGFVLLFQKGSTGAVSLNILQDLILICSKFC